MSRPSVYSSRPSVGRDLAHRRVGQGRRPGRGQPAAGLDRAQQDVGQRVAELHAGEPGQQDGGHLVAPRQLHGEPALTTTTVRGLTAATARTSSSCRPGSASDVRSKPSLSTSSLVPTTTTATSLARASSTAWASSSSAGRVGGPTTSPTRKMKPSAGQRYRMRTSTRRPAASGTDVGCCGGDANIWWMSKTSGLLGLLEHGRAVNDRARACRGRTRRTASRRPRPARSRVHLELRGAVGHGASSRMIVAVPAACSATARRPRPASAADRRSRRRSGSSSARAPRSASESVAPTAVTTSARPSRAAREAGERA